MLPLIEYETLRQRPSGRVAFLQQWRELSFLHFATQPEEIQALLPDGLTLDTFPNEKGQETAWVGLVPFRMQNVTPYGIPPVPGCHAFPETNVRTYVHRQGRRPGVWFFTLEATNAVACRVGRAMFSLPYRHATMSVTRMGNVMHYRSARKRGGPGLEIEAQVAEAESHPQPGSLEFFLAERYLLYAQKGGKLFSGQVSHSPYPVQGLDLQVCEETLIEACGIRPKVFTHTMFSPGVDVEVFALKSD